MRTNPETGIYSGYYRLVESYRNENGRVCHRTILNAGYLDELSREQLQLIQKILTDKTNSDNPSLFELPYSKDPVVNQFVEAFYDRMVNEKRIDVLQANIDKKQDKDIHRIDINTIKNKDVREVGAEWMCYQALGQLNLKGFLEKQGWSEKDINLAQTHIVSRAVYPASELKTSRWIKENSSVCEITGANVDKITKDKLYRISNKLYDVRKEMEGHLSTRTNELFDIEDKIMLYDLTNSYFEGRKPNSKLAKFGRSKEKRSDARLIVLALVVNPFGFIKYSSVFEGNMADSKTLEDMINNLRTKTSSSSKKATVVIDAGIATGDNLKLITNKGYDYICVSRANLTKYSIAADAEKICVSDNRNQKIELCKVQSKKNDDYYLKVESQAKKLKESSMNEQFKERFEEGLQNILNSLSKKGGVKRLDKVHERIGRLKQKYPSIQRYYNIEVEAEELEVNQTKKKQQYPKAHSIKWEIKEGVEINARSGVYFLRTSIKGEMEATLWQMYNTIREIEATFRVLKTDLDLRPIYHKNDDATMAHLNLGLLAYWVVNTIRHQLKNKGIHHQWKELVRVMNTQKAVTTTAQNIKDEIIFIRRCSEPNEQVKQLYDALKYKYVPFTRKKSVVHKLEIFKNPQPNNQDFAET